VTTPSAGHRHLNRPPSAMACFATAKVETRRMAHKCNLVALPTKVSLDPERKAGSLIKDYEHGHRRRCNRSAQQSGLVLVNGRHGNRSLQVGQHPPTVRPSWRVTPLFVDWLVIAVQLRSNSLSLVFSTCSFGFPAL
jgi:hypothetical protein